MALGCGVAKRNDRRGAGTIDLAMNFKSRRSDGSYVSSCRATCPRLTIRAQHELFPFAFPPKKNKQKKAEQGMRGNGEDGPCGPKGHAKDVAP